MGQQEKRRSLNLLKRQKNILATNIVIPETVIKQLNKIPKEVRLKFWEQLEKLNPLSLLLNPYPITPTP
jgi:rRNA-processing protein FCF1